jgi:hypothetical protein
MRTRVYLTAARFVDEPPLQSDLPVERVFVNASDVPEVWVEAESPSIPDVGRIASFALSREMNLGFNRVTGTIERKVRK